MNPPQGGFFDECRARTKLFTTLLLVEGVLGVILGFIGLSAYTACCPLFLWSSPVHIYRIFTSPFISEGFFGLFALLTLFQVVNQVEGERGTLTHPADQSAPSYLRAKEASERGRENEEIFFFFFFMCFRF